MKIALQMYTVRDIISSGDELVAALHRVKELGYDGVEFAGYYGMAADELAKKLAEIGLVAVGSHEMIDSLENELDNVIDYANTLGVRNISLAWSETDTEEKLARTIRVLTEARARAATEGINLLYHNHDHEFCPLPSGKLPIDEIRAICPLEADTYWIFYAGENAPDYLRRHSQSIGLIHLKDGGSIKSSPCALGEGENDITGICTAASDIGAQWLIVENDSPTPSGLEDISRSIKWLREHKI